MAVVALPLKMHKGQRRVLQDRRRFRVVVAGRRWGKTQISKIAAILAASKKKNQLVWYVSPTYGQSRQNFWLPLKAAIPRSWIKKNGINETRMSIALVNGSVIELKGADNPDSLRGVGINFLIMDEAQDIKSDTWYKVLRPTLSSTGGVVLFIGTPKSFNWFYDIFVEGQRGDVYTDEKGKLVQNDFKSWHFPTSSSPFIPAKEIEAARRDMDLKSFKQEYLASFETMSGRVYYPFDRKIHTGDYPFNPLLKLDVGMDFNIDPMSMIFIQEQANGEIWVVDEAILPGSNAEESGDEIVRRYMAHMNRISIYPDPAGNNRNHDRGESALDILREQGFKNIFFRRKHPAVQDRISSVNRLLQTADGTVRMRVNRHCKGFIESLEQTIYKEGTKEVDKRPGTEHATDAFGYYAEFRHPVRKLTILGVSI